MTMWDEHPFLCYLATLLVVAFAFGVGGVWIVKHAPPAPAVAAATNRPLPSKPVAKASGREASASRRAQPASVRTGRAADTARQSGARLRERPDRGARR